MRRLILLTTAVVALAGCRGGTSEEPPVLPPPKVLDHYILPVTNVAFQPRYQAQGENDFFPDRMDMRLPPEGTVARGALKDDDAFYRGLGPDGKPVTDYPREVTAELLERGQVRYDIFCAPCHDRTGRGQGLAPRVGWIPPTSFYDDRVLGLAPGDLFQVITHGVRTMPGYGKQISEADRWAIVAWVQTLQTAGTASLADVPPAQRSNF